MKNILIIVDVQKGFMRTDATKKLALKIQSLLEKKIFDHVVATRFLNEEDSMYERIFNWEGLKTEKERMIPDEILSNVDFVENKYIYNCVNTSFLQKLCQLNDGEYPKSVYVVGVDTDCCVLTVATSLFDNNIRPIVLANYCFSNAGIEQHNAGLKCLNRLIGRNQIIEKDIQKKDDLVV